MAIESLLRFGYFFMLVTIILMILASLNKTSIVRAREIETFKYPPCTFNPLCTCSKPAPDLGIVQCRHVPFPAIPKTINNSKAFMLHMEDTGLRELESYFFQATGLYRLEISHNLITEIPDDSFFGLERSLWELMLQHNELIEVPSRAIRHLQKLTHLDLSGNQISCIEPDSFRGLENSLHTLILSKNSINSLPPDSFSTLPQLDTIDLSGNNLDTIDTNIFRDGMPRLSKLLLSDNILSGIPYIATASLKQLRTLDLSYNLIQEILTDRNFEPKAVVKLTLDALHLEYNLIETIPTGSFQHFDIINQTYLDGNPISVLEEEAFRPAKIKELYIRHCSLQYVSPIAFEGLGNSLQVLDLSANNITSLPDSVFDNFDVFRVLNLKDNKIKELNPADVFNGFQYTLLKLDLSGEKNPVLNLQELRRMRNMRSLSVTKLSTKHLSPDDFLEFGLELEDLKITRGHLQSIKSHAFMHVRGLKRLDLSENQINQIEGDAFNEIGHSLISLKISHGLTGTALPSDAMRHLTSLQQLDISNNQLKTMSDTSFHFLKNLKILEIQDNRIENVLKGTFQGDIHSKLEMISMSFNHLRQISQHTFVDLEALQRLKLDDNQIEHLERRAFMNLDQLRYLNLRGNKLNSISDEAFQIFKDDPLPQHICPACETVVVDYFERIKMYETLEKRWLSEADRQNTNQIKDVLNAVEAECVKIRQTLTTVLPDYPSHHKHNILAAVIKETIRPSSSASGNPILKSLLLDNQVFNVKTLQQICIDNFNVNGRRYLNSVLDYELPPISTDEEQSKIDEDSLDTSQFEMSRRIKKKKRRNPLRDYIRRGKRKRIGTTERLNEVNSIVENELTVDNKSDTQQNTANTQNWNDIEINETPSPVRKKPGPKPKNKTPQNCDGTSSDTQFIHWKKPGPQAKLSINSIEHKRLRRSRRRFEHENSTEIIDDETNAAKKVKRSAINDEEQSTDPLNVSTESNNLTNENVDDINVPSAIDADDTIDGEKNGLPDALQPVTTGKAKIFILNPKEVLKDSEELVDENVNSELVTANSVDSHDRDTQSQSEDSNERPSSKNRKRRDETDVVDVVDNKKKRQTSRINYSEALVDEALMYEEMLLNQQAKEQLFIASTIESSKHTAKTVDLGKNNFSMDYFEESDVFAKKTVLDVSLENLGEICVSRKEKSSKEICSPNDNLKKKEIATPDVGLSEISITPISKQKTAPIVKENQLNVSLKEIKQTFKSNPEFVFNISSAVSIQLKSPTGIKAESNQMLKGPTTCQYCRKTLPDIKQLAVHQLNHLKIETHKIGSPLVLSPSYRRGRMVPMGNNKCFRCLNCWRLYPNSQSILQHWVTGKCIFYCSICGKSFHQNPKLIRDHFPEVHGIKFKMPTNSSPPGLSSPTNEQMLLATHTAQRINRAKFKEHIRGAATAPGTSSFSVIKMKPPTGRVKCHICSCSFPNMQSRNSHMRLHKNEKEPGKPTSIRVQLPSQQRPIPISFNNIQQRQLFPNANRIQPNHTVGSNRPFRMMNLQRSIKSVDQQRPPQPSFPNQQSPQRMNYPQPTTFNAPNNFGTVKIKTESNYEEFNTTDYQGSNDFPEYSELFQSETTTEPSAVVSTNFIKTEVSQTEGVPRLQVKKLHELQEPNYVSPQPISVNTYYTPTSIQPIVNAIPQYQLAAPLQLQVPQLQPIQPQFQIASVQHVQNTQYYNPVLVVSQPAQQHHTQDGYQYVPDQVDYSKYYS